MNENNNEVRLVGRKSNMPILIVLALIAIAFLGYIVWKTMNTDDLVTTEVATTTLERLTTIQNDAADTIENIAGIYAVTDGTELHNENVELNDVTVSSVVSERLFLVDEGSPNQFLLVLLDTNLTDDEEELIPVAAGQKLNVEGELKYVAEEDMDVSIYTAAEVSAVTSQRVFLNATKVDVK